jgi:hypothetical protein
MSKKVLVFMILAAVVAENVFSQEKLFSIGGGAMLVPSFGEMKFKEMEMGGVKFTPDPQKSSGFGGGLNLFFDATYAEVNLGLLFANQKSGENDDKGTDTTNLLLGIVGKYPISLSEQLALFPFLGIDYLINLGASRDGNKLEDSGDMFNALSLLFGVGVDYSLTESLYIRGEVGFGITFNTKLEDDAKDMIDSNFKGKIPIKVAIGYRL